MKAIQRYRIDPTYSPDDGGHYVEIVDPATGRTVHTTKVFSTERKAVAAAHEWMERQDQFMSKGN